MTTGEIRCPGCHRRLYDVENIVLNPEAAIIIKCRCKEKVKLSASALTLVVETS